MGKRFVYRRRFDQQTSENGVNIGMTKVMIRTILTLLVLLSSPSVKAIDFGFTPSHVYGIWVNINMVFVDFLRCSSLTDAQVQQITSLIPKHFSGKQPKDVYAQVELTKQHLEQIFQLPTLSHRPDWIDYYDMLQHDVENTVIHPSAVFILSSQLLRALVQQYIEVSPSHYPISPFFSDRNLNNKSPSDVFSKVDLFKRRLLIYQQLIQSAPQKMEGSRQC